MAIYPVKQKDKPSLSCSMFLRNKINSNEFSLNYKNVRKSIMDGHIIEMNLILKFKNNNKYTNHI